MHEAPVDAAARLRFSRFARWDTDRSGVRWRHPALQLPPHASGCSPRDGRSVNRAHLNLGSAIAIWDLEACPLFGCVCARRIWSGHRASPLRRCQRRRRAAPASTRPRLVYWTRAQRIRCFPFPACALPFCLSSDPRRSRDRPSPWFHVRSPLLWTSSMNTSLCQLVGAAPSSATLLPLGLHALHSVVRRLEFGNPLPCTWEYPAAEGFTRHSTRTRRH